MLPNLDQFIRKHGIETVGVADLSILFEKEPKAMDLVPRDFSRGIILGIRLEDAVIDQIEDRPTLLYFHMYRQANFTLDRTAFTLALELQRHGYRAIAVPASQLLDPGGRRPPPPPRLLGHMAGIGWIGRPTLLVHPDYGARMRYASVITNAPYKAGAPTKIRCQECRVCIEACPVQAIKNSSRKFDIDACFAKVNEFRKLPFIGHHICGICVKACRGPGCV